MSVRRRLPQALLICTVLLCGSVAPAESAQAAPFVVLLERNKQEITSEVLLRIQGELTADGLRIEHAQSAPLAERLSLVRERCGRAQGSIIAGLFIDERNGDIEMLFCDPTSGREAHRQEHMPASAAGDPPEAIARHVVDLLRAGLLDFAAEMPAAALPAPEPAVPAQMSQNRTQATFRVRAAIEPGASVLVGLGGLGPSITPLLRLRATLTPWLQLRVTGAGLGTTPRVTAARGSATVAQKFGVADVTLPLAPSTRLGPLIVLGAGAYGATVSGTGVAPYSGASSSGAAFVLDGGVGLAPWITPNLSIAVEAHAMYSVPPMAVRFLNADVARLGQPVLMLSVSLAEWL